LWLCASPTLRDEPRDSGIDDGIEAVARRDLVVDLAQRFWRDRRPGMPAIAYLIPRLSWVSWTGTKVRGSTSARN
jgi:hypothetical protein